MVSHTPSSTERTSGDESPMGVYDRAVADAQAKIDAIQKKNAEFAAVLRPILVEVLKTAPESMFGNSPTLEEKPLTPDLEELPEDIRYLYPQARFLICGRDKGWIGYKEPETKGEFNAWCFKNDGQYTFILKRSNIYGRDEVANFETPISIMDRSFQTALRDRLITNIAKYSVQKQER